MKTRFTILFVFLTLTGFSQMEFAPIGAKWYYSEPGFSGNPLSSYERYIVERDTVIESKKGQIIKSQNFKEVVYSENNKVYYRFKNDFKLIYDFNVNEGDTVEFDFKSYSFNSSVIDTTYKVKCVVNSIDSVENNGNYLKKFSTTILQDNSLDHIVWESNYSYMEKIGYEYDFMFALSIPSIDEMHNLRCYEDEQINYTSEWWKYQNKECDFSLKSSVRTSSNSYISSIYPNPFTDIIEININNETCSENCYFKIIDNTGKSIFEGFIKNQHVKMEVSNLSKGVYYIIVYGNNSVSENHKIIKL